MRQASKRIPDSAEKTVRDIRRATRRHHSAEEKIRIVCWKACAARTALLSLPQGALQQIQGLPAQGRRANYSGPHSSYSLLHSAAAQSARMCANYFSHAGYASI
jgi:hypothetical protein